MRTTLTSLALFLLVAGCTASNPGSGSDASATVGDMAGCGAPGASCCAGRGCSAGSSCIGAGAGVCTLCGGAGEACCPGDECSDGGCCVAQICTGAGSTCPGLGGTCANGSCGTCGAVGQPCCQSMMQGGRPTCTAQGAACAAGQCVACGGAGQACCGDGTCTADGTVCGNNVCQACGAGGEICCANASCGNGLACTNNNLCAQCGAPGQPCCANKACGAGCCDNQSVCVADGAACPMGGTCQNMTCSQGMGGCGNGQPFPMFVKTCTNNDSCAIGDHEINCCGSQLALGFNHDQTGAFQAAEATWEKTCGGCGCPAMPLVAEDGKSCLMKMPTVSCDNGMCTTHCD